MGRAMNKATRFLAEKPTHVAGWGCALAAVAIAAFTFPAVAAKANSARITTAAPINVSIESTQVMTHADGLVSKLADSFLIEAAPVKSVAAKLIDNAEFQAREHKCLSQAIFYESRSEGKDGQKAVAEVIQNRVRSKHYPNSICGVVFQGSQRRTGCQFSFTCDGSMELAPKGKTWLRANNVAALAMTGGITPITGRATHYHTLDVQPVWSDTLVMTKQIETHKFYRTRWRERPVVSASLSVAPPSP